MNKKSYLYLPVFITICLAITTLFSFVGKTSKTGKLRVIFINTANKKQLVLRDSVYTNAFGEKYTISKLKYYISNFSVPGCEQVNEESRHHLINAADSNNEFELTLSAGDYRSVSFLLGVDSMSNCSGAQDGALDPMNDMFWTWNSGYVMFKLEGTSDSSKADLERIEHHIGGYKGAQAVITMIDLALPASQSLHIHEGSTSELVIETDLDHYWKNTAETRISETPVCTLPGPLAKKIASNFSGLFSIRSLK